jgi:hypothetical protein
MSREDEVAAVLFWRTLTPEALEGMKNRLLGMGEKGKDRPNPNTRLGLVLIALTTPDIEEPSEEELEKALPRVRLLLTEEEKHRLEGWLSKSSMAEIENKEENPEMSGVIERLRASKQESETQEFQAGWDAGRAWAEKYAEVSELKRLEAWRDDRSKDECRYEVPQGNAFDAAEHLAFALCPGDQSHSGAREFWECAVGDNVPHDDIAQPEFLRGFVEGALDVWDKVKDQI